MFNNQDGMNYDASINASVAYFSPDSALPTPFFGLWSS